MPKRNVMEAVHPEHMEIPKIFHLKEVVIGGIGEKYGVHMAICTPRGRQQAVQTDTCDKFMHTVVQVFGI